MRKLHAFIRLTIFLIAAFILGISVSYFRTINRPMRATATATDTYELTIAKGDGPRAVAAKLSEAGALDTDRVFLLYVLLSDTRDRFFPGTYTLAKSASIRDVVDTLTAGKVNQVTITTLEGWRITDIAKEVAKKTKVTEAEFLAAAPVEEYEGYLFPDTYNFRPEVTVTEIIKTMRQNFDTRAASAGLVLTSDDVILASIVERESRTDADRPMVAAVYLNRLAIDMALDADPTIQYAKGDWEPVTLAEYRSVISPYNTYLSKGLPPTAISNPSLASLKAVKEPAEHDYFYFFHASDGQTYFSKTLAEHNTNKVKYLR
jgi:UPF0755 protein